MSIAITYKAWAIAVVLTGSGTDGALGVLSIKEHGDMTIAQDKLTSEFFNLLEAAIAPRKVDLVLPLEAIASTLVHAVTSAAVA